MTRSTCDVLYVHIKTTWPYWYTIIAYEQVNIEHFDVSELLSEAVNGNEKDLYVLTNR
jgi:hypothetical protein